MHACACADNGREKRYVLIVSVLLPIAVNFALRSNTQRRIEVLGSMACVCLFLQDLVQSCLRGEGGILEDMCYERRRAEACVD